MVLYFYTQTQVYIQNFVIDSEVQKNAAYILEHKWG
jgi:hypothetical protein